MHAKAIVGAAALAGFSMIQMSPAPVWAVVPAIAGVVAKTLQVVLDEISERDLPDGGFEIKGRIPSAKFDRRQQQSCFGPVKDGVPSNVVENCCGQMPGADITVTGSSITGVQINGLPADCIPLAPWVDGTGVVPYACGPYCIEYAGLSAEEYGALKNAFESKV